MQQEEASAMNKSSASVVEKGPSITPVHDLQQKSDQAVRKEQEEKSSNKGQGEDQQKEDSVEDPSLQDLPSAKEPTDFLPFRRSVVETDTMLE